MLDLQLEGQSKPAWLPPCPEGKEVAVHGLYNIYENTNEVMSVTPNWMLIGLLNNIKAKYPRVCTKDTFCNPNNHVLWTFHQ
jgi:hypothetical protein